MLEKISTLDHLTFRDALAIDIIASERSSGRQAGCDNYGDESKGEPHFVGGESRGSL